LAPLGADLNADEDFIAHPYPCLNNYALPSIKPYERENKKQFAIWNHKDKDLPENNAAEKRSFGKVLGIWGR